MPEITLLSLCGLHCDLCAQRSRIPRQAQALRESLHLEGLEYWGPSLPGFDGFQVFLANLCEPDKSCPGCRQGGGPPDCAVRACALDRGVQSCPFCPAFPCEPLQTFAKVYPTIIIDGARLATIGFEAWNAEQQQRAKTGFTYSDIRCPSE